MSVKETNGRREMQNVNERDKLYKGSAECQ